MKLADELLARPRFMFAICAVLTIVLLPPHNIAKVAELAAVGIIWLALFSLASARMFTGALRFVVELVAVLAFLGIYRVLRFGEKMEDQIPSYFEVLFVVVTIAGYYWRRPKRSENGARGL